MIYATLSFVSGKNEDSYCTVCIQFKDEQQFENYESNSFDDLIGPINNVLQDGHYVDDVIELESLSEEKPIKIDLDMSRV